MNRPRKPRRQSNCRMPHIRRAARRDASQQRRFYHRARPSEATLPDLSALWAFGGALAGALVGATIGYLAGLRIARRQHLRDVKFGAYEDPLRQIQEALNTLDLWAHVESIELKTDDTKAFQDALATLLTILLILEGKLDFDGLVEQFNEADLNEEDERKKLLDSLKTDVVLSFFVDLVGFLREVEASQPTLEMVEAPADVSNLVTELALEVAGGMGLLMTRSLVEQPLARPLIETLDQKARADIRKRLVDLRQAMMNDLKATL